MTNTNNKTMKIVTSLWYTINDNNWTRTKSDFLLFGLWYHLNMEYSSHPMMTNNSRPRDYNACDCFASTDIALAIKRMLCFPFRTTDGRFNNSSHTIPMSYMVKEINTFKSLIEAKEAKSNSLQCSYRMHVFRTYVSTSHRHEEKPITLRNRCHEILTTNYSLL